LRQDNAKQLHLKIAFSEKNKLPQPGLKLATYSILCRCSTNWATEAAQLGRPNL